MPRVQHTLPRRVTFLSFCLAGLVANACLCMEHTSFDAAGDPAANSGWYRFALTSKHAKTRFSHHQRRRGGKDGRTRGRQLLRRLQC